MSMRSEQWGGQFYHHGGASDSSAVTLGGPNNSISKPRRRSRVSRKAPTTLLNASTANFRDLVQQFTGFQAGRGGVALGSHKGPVNLSFGQPGDHHDLHNNLSFSDDGLHFQLRQPCQPPPTEHRFPFPPESTTGDDSGFSRPAAELTEIQNLIDEDLNYDLQDLAMDFSSSTGNGNYPGGYFH